MKGANVKVFDQVTAVAFPGSSGGGMFLKDNGEYIGMLTQGVMKLQGFNFIVPVRRIHACRQGRQDRVGHRPRRASCPPWRRSRRSPWKTPRRRRRPSRRRWDSAPRCRKTVGFDFSSVRSWVDLLRQA